MPRITRPLLWSLLTAALPVATLAAADCSVKSGNSTVALLELYTSEGCDSCPPADRWVSELRRTGLAPDRVVPLAFHVDYWNYLGWTDRFAQSLFTQRQQNFVRYTRANTAYTPEIVLNGAEYRRWTS